jgi:hypothetical protein
VLSSVPRVAESLQLSPLVQTASKGLQTTHSSLLYLIRDAQTHIEHITLFWAPSLAAGGGRTIVGARASRAVVVVRPGTGASRAVVVVRPIRGLGKNQLRNNYRLGSRHNHTKLAQGVRVKGVGAGQDSTSHAARQGSHTD